MRRLIFTAILFALFPTLWGGHAGAAKVTIEGASVVVGDPSGDHALYRASPAITKQATAINMKQAADGMNGKLLQRLGGRAIVSFTDAQSWAKLEVAHQITGKDISALTAEAPVEHMVLIPENREVLQKLGSLSLDGGTIFTMKGRSLAFKDAVVDGKVVPDLKGADYFLLSSIENG